MLSLIQIWGGKLRQVFYDDIKSEYMLDLRYTQLPFIHMLQKELYPCIPIKAILYFIIIAWSYIFIQMHHAGLNQPIWLSHDYVFHYLEDVLVVVGRSCIVPVELQLMLTKSEKTVKKIKDQSNFQRGKNLENNQDNYTLGRLDEVKYDVGTLYILHSLVRQTVF